MQWVLRVIVAIVFGINFGALTALWYGGLISGGPTIGNAINVDDWRSDWSIGSENANPYVRARVARNGLLALRKEEAVYFTKAVDDEGEPLREACSYQVSGGAFPAGWWSITLYDGKSRLPMNQDGHLSYDQTQAVQIAEASPDWAFQVSATAPDAEGAPWVSSAAAGQFDLMLRLYQPEAALLEDPEAVFIAPSITRLSCDGEAG